MTAASARRAPATVRRPRPGGPCRVTFAAPRSPEGELHGGRGPGEPPAPRGRQRSGGGRSPDAGRRAGPGRRPEPGPGERADPGSRRDGSGRSRGDGRPGGTRTADQPAFPVHDRDDCGARRRGDLRHGRAVYPGPRHSHHHRPGAVHRGRPGSGSRLAGPPSRAALGGRRRGRCLHSRGRGGVPRGGDTAADIAGQHARPSDPALPAQPAGSQFAAGQAQCQVPHPAAADQAGHQPGDFPGRRGPGRGDAGTQHGLGHARHRGAQHLLPGRPAPDQAVRLPARAALAAAPGDPDRRRDPGQGRRLRAGELHHLGDRRRWHLLLAARVRHSLSAPAGHVRGPAGPDSGHRVNHRRRRGDPRRADRIAAGGHRHAGLLHRLPAGRGLPHRAPDHGPHRPGARDRQPDSGPDRRRAARDRRRAGRDSRWPRPSGCCCTRSPSAGSTEAESRPAPARSEEFSCFSARTPLRDISSPTACRAPFSPPPAAP